MNQVTFRTMRIAAITLAVVLAAAFWTGNRASAQEPNWIGRVTAMPASGLVGQWTVNGRTFVSSEATDYRQDKGPLAVGVCAEVEYVGAGEPYTATKIASKSDDNCTAGTSTPSATPSETPSATPSETPTPLGTPIIVFAPDDVALKEGRCTFVRWNVKNVREVYYENLPMSGQGEREECIEDEPKVFRLLVVMGDGSTQTYTTTVGYLPPTPTPTVTPSFTPEPVMTPTWTPVPSTPTPVPNIRYGVVLAPSASTSVTCERGQNCDVGLLLTNSGEAPDTLALMLVQGGALPAQLCRPDGVCAGNDLQVAGVGPGNTAYVLLRVSTPGDAAAQSTSYVVQGASTGSNRSQTSQAVTIQVTVP